MLLCGAILNEDIKDDGPWQQLSSLNAEDITTRDRVNKSCMDTYNDALKRVVIPLKKNTQKTRVSIATRMLAQREHFLASLQAPFPQVSPGYHRKVLSKTTPALLPHSLQHAQASITTHQATHAPRTPRVSSHWTSLSSPPLLSPRSRCQTILCILSAAATASGPSLAAASKACGRPGSWIPASPVLQHPRPQMRGVDGWARGRVEPQPAGCDREEYPGHNGDDEVRAQYRCGSKLSTLRAAPPKATMAPACTRTSRTCTSSANLSLTFVYCERKLGPSSGRVTP